MERARAKAPAGPPPSAPARAPAREPLATLHATAGNDAVAKLVVQRMMLQRFVSQTTETLHTIRPNRVLTQTEYTALLADLDRLATLLARHQAGDTEGSPFISLTRDFNVAAQTTDTAPGGLGSIVHNAPRVACFDIPDQYCYVAGGDDNLQGLEREVLVLLPPGKSLADFVLAVQPNPYLGRYWNAGKL